MEYWFYLFSREYRPYDEQPRSIVEEGEFHALLGEQLHRRTPAYFIGLLQWNNCSATGKTQRRREEDSVGRKDPTLSRGQISSQAGYTLSLSWLKKWLLFTFLNLLCLLFFKFSDFYTLSLTFKIFCIVQCLIQLRS